MSILDAFRLDGKVALVTGANRGLGQAMALALAEGGADVVGLSRTSGDTGAQIETLGRRYHPIQYDLVNITPEDAKSLITQVVDTLGRIDILVNNAGIVKRTPALEYDPADWQAILQINLNAVYYLSQAAARVMDTLGGGKIINVGSLLSIQGGILVPAYAAAKHGVAGLTKAFANEWAVRHINVNAIIPGYIDTDINTALINDPVRSKALMERIPARRWGKPDDLKGITLLLASSASDYIHGVLFPVDGGWLAR